MDLDTAVYLVSEIYLASNDGDWNFANFETAVGDSAIAAALYL